jgi:hypothetical protein
VCQSEIKISVDAEAAPDEARNRKVARRVIDSPTAQERPAEPQVQEEHLSVVEREEKIAAAREAHPVSAYPLAKPRLDKILGDEQNKEAA